MQTSFLAAKYLRCFLQKGGEACICLWRSNCSMFNSTPVYPQGGETHLSDFILLTPRQKVEPTGRFCLYKINVFLIKFRLSAPFVDGGLLVPPPLVFMLNPPAGGAGSPSKQSKNTDTHVWTHTSELLVLLWVNLANSDKLNHSSPDNANLIKCD